MTLWVYSISPFSVCWINFRANSSGSILLPVENLLPLILRLVSSDLSVSSFCSVNHYSGNSVCSQICWKSQESPFSSKLSGIITSSIRFCLRRNLNCSVNNDHQSWKQEQQAVTFLDLWQKSNVYAGIFFRDDADHQQPLWLLLHLSRRDNCDIYQRCRRADGYWCE